jgi:hypothetical protein
LAEKKKENKLEGDDPVPVPEKLLSEFRRNAKIKAQQESEIERAEQHHPIQCEQDEQARISRRKEIWNHVLTN